MRRSAVGAGSGHRRIAAAVTALVLATGCSGSDDHPDVETLGSSPTSTATTASPTPTPTSTPTTESSVDPTVVPDEVTVEYLDAVMERLNALEARVYRLVAESQDVTDPVATELYASFAESSMAVDTLEGFEEAFGLEAIAEPPAPPVTTGIEILDQTDDCVLFRAQHDPRPLMAPGVDVEPTQPHYFRLRPSEPNELNPVPWKMDFAFGIVEDHPGPSTCDEVEDYL